MLSAIGARGRNQIRCNQKILGRDEWNLQKKPKKLERCLPASERVSCQPCPSRSRAGLLGPLLLTHSWSPANQLYLLAISPSIREMFATTRASACLYKIRVLRPTHRQARG